MMFYILSYIQYLIYLLLRRTFYICEIDDISLKRQNILYFRQLSYFTVIRISKLIYTPKVLIAAALYWMIAKQKTICPLDLVINVTITDTNKIFSADKVITNFQRISRQHWYTLRCLLISHIYIINYMLVMPWFS